ncbi:glycoside hydrolase family 26 protein [Mobilicoccus massiliensis]|uniref:glycoside hydrolase family 26 protein n=1 Tax=Mobilicoccus massiliensis TaxID=1522310 RepID=UPI00114477DD|nr:glycosyl hydrolase [Mobilicoccus massiliensis]
MRSLASSATRIGAAAGVALLLATTSAGLAAEASPPAGKPGGQAERYIGRSASAHSWYSGAWTGGYLSGTRAKRWGAWRGTVSDAALTYPERGTWQKIAGSTWHIDTFKNFRGVLVYGMPLLPSDGSSSLADVAAGKHDAVFRKVARDLQRRNRGRSIVRIGWEGNGHWYAWSADASNAADYRRAFARVSTVMKKSAPKLVIDFDINCGSPLRGGSNRLDALTKLYPGDRYVDLIGCDVYDWHTTGATNSSEWRQALQPENAPGLADVAAFARKRGKGLSVPEWGLAKTETGGNGDNPFFIRSMRSFFTSNADILVMEGYFNEHAEYIRNSLWSEKPQNPKSAQVYRSLW